MRHVDGIDDIVRLTCRAAVSVDRLCTRLNLSHKDLRATVKEGAAAGYSVAIVDGFVASRVKMGPTKTITLGSDKPGRKQVVHFTDPHFGSRHCAEGAALTFLREAWDRGARVAACTGDILDGAGPKAVKLIADQDYVGFDHQAQRAVDLMKSAPPFAWVAIDGNHDGYCSDAMGCVSGAILESRMRAAGVNWSFAGMCEGRARLHGADWYLWHPHGDASSRNALRRKLNEKAEALEEHADVIAIGHYHRFVSIPIYPEKVFGIAGGTWQLKKSEFANRITRPWDIGGSIVSYTVDRKGKAREFSAEFLPAGGLR